MIGLVHWQNVVAVAVDERSGDGDCQEPKHNGQGVVVGVCGSAISAIMTLVSRDDLVFGSGS